jgi:cytochrome oxidase Cu insertion factor (SCO1/SenC/PrrC family)
MSKLRRIGDRLGVPLAIWAVFTAPWALALLVYGRPDWQPAGRLEQGELIDPVRVLDPSGLLDSAGQPLGDTLFRGRWTLLYRSGAGCPDECLGLMDTLKRVCRAQARGPDRVGRVLVAPGLTEDERRTLRHTDPGLQLALTAAPWGPPAGQVYLVDPLGNLVLRYPPGFAPQGLAKDLGRLLRPSWAG